jgi:enoyl-CoA hydratase
VFRHLELVERDTILVVSMNRPEVRNALSIDLMEELTACALQCEARSDVAAVVLAGGADYFSAGADLKDPKRWNASAQSLVEQRRLAGLGYRMCEAWEKIPQITIAAIAGYALGGGLAIALACDFRVAEENSLVGFPEVSLGLPLTWGSIARMVQLAGPTKAKRLTILCERLAAPVAYDMGLLDYLCAPGEALTRATELARSVAAMPQAVVRMSKETINATANALLHLGAHGGADQFAWSAASEEARAARAAFSRKKARDAC